MKLFFWAADEAGCGYYRTQLPARVLADRGHTVNVTHYNVPSWANADTILGQRVCNPGPSAVWRRWHDEGRFLVYDLDDDLLAVERGSGVLSWEFFAQPSIQEAVRTNLALANRVTAATDRLAEVARQFNDNVVVVPNGLPASLLERPAPERGKRFTIGWAGSTATLADLAQTGAAKALSRILRRAQDVEVHTVGVDPSALSRAGMGGGGVRATRWVHGTEQYLAAVDFHAWVAPYRDIPFNQSKVPTKALEAGFLGVPLVASDIAPYRAAITHGKTGFLVRADHEWGHYLRLLAVDEPLRQRMGRAAREWASRYVIEGLAPAWEEALTR